MVNVEPNSLRGDMELAEALDVIRGKEFLIVFPSGWIARPWDNLYTVEKVTKENDTFVVDLGTNWNVVFDDTSTFLFAENSLFVNVSKANVNMPTETIEYNGGYIVFITPNLQTERQAFELYKRLNTQNV